MSAAEWSPPFADRSPSSKAEISEPLRELFMRSINSSSLKSPTPQQLAAPPLQPAPPAVPLPLAPALPAPSPATATASAKVGCAFSARGSIQAR